MPLFKNKTTPEIRAVFDIDDYSVGATIVTHGESGKEPPQVVWSHRQMMPINRHTNNEHHHNSMRQALQSVQKRMHRQGLTVARKRNLNDKISDVVCVLDTPWQTEKTISSKLSKVKPFFVNKESVNTVRQLAHKEFLQAHKSKDYSDKFFNHLHQHIISIYTDGQPLTSLPKEPVTNLEVFMYISKISSDVQQSLYEIFQELFHPDKITFLSSSKVISHVLTDRFTHPRDFLVVKPNRTHTRILLVQNGELTDTKEHAIGEDFVVRTTANALGFSLNEARSRLRLHRNNKQHKSLNKEIDIALEEIGKRWINLLNDKIDSLATSSLPNYIYLFMPQTDTSPIFRRFYEEISRQKSESLTHVADDSLFENHFQDSHQPDRNLAINILGTSDY